MHISYNDMLAAAVPLRDEHGNLTGAKEAVIEIGPGDTAVHPGSTKWVFRGPNKISYYVSPAFVGHDAEFPGRVTGAPAKKESNMDRIAATKRADEIAQEVRLTKNQTTALARMLERGSWSENAPWVWDTKSGTDRICRALANKGLLDVVVEAQGDFGWGSYVPSAKALGQDSP